MGVLSDEEATSEDSEGKQPGLDWGFWDVEFDGE